MDSAPAVLGTLVVSLAITFVIFLVIREVVLWYFRLNQIANDIAYIANHFRAINKAVEPPRADAPPPPANRQAPAGIRPAVR